MRDGIYSALFTEICKLPVIDTHEHLPWDEHNRYNANRDVLSEYLMHYMSSDIISAGLSRRDFNAVIDAEGNINDRWRIAEPFWEASRYTGYGRALDIAVNGIYGIDGINRNTIEELNARFLENRKPGHYRRVLRDLCNIETSLLDVWTFHIDGENELFRRIWQPMNYIMPADPEGHNVIEHIRRKFSIDVKCLDDWLDALGAELDCVIKLHGVNILKCSIAYSRSLLFEKVDYSVAREQFDKAFGQWESELKPRDVTMQFPRELQDYMMHSVMRLANARNMTIQFHTGLLEGNGNILTNSDPALLTNLFIEYPDVDFDLFHISYPFQNVACALGKMFPNVFIDMCWAHIISPSASVLALDDFLDAVPYNKISAFGGDYLFPDGVYGHLYMSRQNISRMLSGKVQRRIFSEEKAMEIAKALYYDNPKRIFKL